jgi:hypothetical protein
MGLGFVVARFSFQLGEVVDGGEFVREFFHKH